MNRARYQNRIYFFLLLLLTILALGVRVWGIAYGELVCFSHDEQIHLRTALKFYRGSLNPRDIWASRHFLYVFYSWFSMYLVAVIYHLFTGLRFFFSSIINQMVAISGYRVDSVVPIPFPLRQGISEREALYIGRFTVALFGAATVPLVYVIGKKLRDRRSGLLAAALMAFIGYHVANCHWMKNDIIAAFFLMAAFLFSTRIFLKGKTIDYVLAAVFSALAVNSKQNTAPIIVTILLAHLWGEFRPINQPFIRRLIDRKIVISGVIFLIIFIVSYPLFYLELPYIINNLHDLISRTETQAMFGGLGTQARPLSFFQIRRNNLINFVRFSSGMVSGMGGYILVLGLGGIIMAAVKRERRLLFLASFPVVYLIAAVLVASPGVRYQDTIPLYGFFALLASMFLESVFRLLLVKDRRIGRAMLIGGGVLLWPYLLTVVRLDYGYWQLSSKYFATRWFARNIPPGSQVILESKTVDLDKERYPSHRVRAIWGADIKKLKETGVDYLVVSSRHERRALEETGLFGPDHPYGKSYLDISRYYNLIKTFDMGPIPYKAGYSKIYRVKEKYPLSPEGLNSGLLRHFQNDLSTSSAPLLFLNELGQCEGDTNMIVDSDHSGRRLLISPVALSALGVEIINGPHRVEARLKLGRRLWKMELAPGQARVVVGHPDRDIFRFKNSYRVNVSLQGEGACLVRILPDAARIGLAYWEEKCWDQAIQFLNQAAKESPGDWYIPCLIESAAGQAGLRQETFPPQAVLKKLCPDTYPLVEDLVMRPVQSDRWRDAFQKETGFPVDWLETRAGSIWRHKDLEVKGDSLKGFRLASPRVFYLPRGRYRIELNLDNQPESGDDSPMLFQLYRNGQLFREWTFDSRKNETPPETPSFINPEFGDQWWFQLKVSVASRDRVTSINFVPSLYHWLAGNEYR